MNKITITIMVKIFVGSLVTINSPFSGSTLLFLLISQLFQGSEIAASGGIFASYFFVIYLQFVDAPLACQLSMPLVLVTGIVISQFLSPSVNPVVTI